MHVVGVCILDESHLVSVSIDQRLVVWNVTLQPQIKVCHYHMSIFGISSSAFIYFTESMEGGGQDLQHSGNVNIHEKEVDKTHGF